MVIEERKMVAVRCSFCGGEGFVPQPIGPTVVCLEYCGTGDDASAPAMVCLKCHGRGRVPGR